VKINIDSILPNPEQPRKLFDEDELQSLADSISANGVIVPIVVEHAGNGYYLLHDGERRLRASKMAGESKIEAQIVSSKDFNPEDRLMRALVANIQRSDLNPIEEAEAFKKLIDEMDVSPNRIAQMLGISAPIVSARIKLLELDSEIQMLIAMHKLPKDKQAIQAFLSIEDRELRVKLAQRLAERNATVRMVTEACARVIATARENESSEPIPSIRFAQSKAGKPEKSKWNALQEAGKIPDWKLVHSSAEKTCANCALAEQASKTVCNGCPLPEFLSKLIKKVNDDPE
jgi:ParB family chromosome partitioning protein